MPEFYQGETIHDTRAVWPRVQILNSVWLSVSSNWWRRKDRIPLYATASLFWEKTILNWLQLCVIAALSWFRHSEFVVWMLEYLRVDMNLLDKFLRLNHSTLRGIKMILEPQTKLDNSSIGLFWSDNAIILFVCCSMFPIFDGNWTLKELPNSWGKYKNYCSIFIAMLYTWRAYSTPVRFTRLHFHCNILCAFLHRTLCVNSYTAHWKRRFSIATGFVLWKWGEMEYYSMFIVVSFCICLWIESTANSFAIAKILTIHYVQNR